jgi:hypothetical protein
MLTACPTRSLHILLAEQSLTALCGIARSGFPSCDLYGLRRLRLPVSGRAGEDCCCGSPLLGTDDRGDPTTVSRIGSSLSARDPHHSIWDSDRNVTWRSALIHRLPPIARATPSVISAADVPRPLTAARMASRTDAGINEARRPKATLFL